MPWRRMMMRRFLFCIVTVLTILMFEVPASASVTTEGESGMNYTINRPVVHTGNNQIEAMIRADIEQYIHAFQKDFFAGEFINGTIRYQVMYEDMRCVSILLSDYRFYGGNHGIPIYYGLNYDKSTGQRIPLLYFVRLRPEDNSWFGQMSVYDVNNKEIKWEYLSRSPYNQPVPNNYYMLGNGELALVYQPCDLASYADGVTHIKLTREWIDFFNRKNK